MFLFSNRVPTHTQNPFSILFQYLFNTEWKTFDTITYLQFSKKLFLEHKGKNTCKIVISGNEQNLVNKWVNLEFPYFMCILTKFNTFSKYWKPISQFNTFNTAWEACLNSDTWTTNRWWCWLRPENKHFTQGFRLSRKITAFISTSGIGTFRCHSNHGRHDTHAEVIEELSTIAATLLPTVEGWYLCMHSTVQYCCFLTVSTMRPWRIT